MTRFIKILLTSLTAMFIIIGYSNISFAMDHTAERQTINELKKEIIELGGDPVKKKGLFTKDKKWIIELQKQFEELKKESKAEKEKKAAIEAVKKEILKELEALGVKPIVDTKDIDTNEEIIELRKQLEEEKKKAEEKKEAEKKKAAIEALKNDIKKEIEALGEKPITENNDIIDKDEVIIALRKQLAEIKAKKEEEEKKRIAEEKEKKRIAEEKEKKRIAEEKEKEKREAAIIRVKKEIYFLGGTPIAEFEVESEDAYIEALKKQIEELKIQKEAEEKEIAESIPEWYLMPPQGSDVLMYVRGSAVSDQLQLALDFATNAALKNLGKKVETRVASKAKQTIRQAGMGEDQVSKTEINLISSTVMEEVTLSGYKMVETKLVSLDSGSYRAFILLEYPVAKAYKSYIEKIEKSSELKGRLTAIKNTDIYKELKKAVARYSGS